MTQNETPIDQVLEYYPVDFRPTQVEALGSAGGFSGARFWRLRTPRGELCLRRWPPEHPDAAGLEFIQSVLRRVTRNGFSSVPAPIPTRTATGYIQYGGHLWELTPWLPGHADYLPERKPEKLTAALAALARFHIAAADFPPVRSPAASPGLMRRVEQLERLRSGGIGRLKTALAAFKPIATDWTELMPLGRELLRLFSMGNERVRQTLVAACRIDAPIQPCIRDIWHDHVLFQGDHVSGLIDFGALRPDHVAGDLARLLGSMAGDDPSAWQRGLTAYENLRPLSLGEQQLVVAFDQSATLLAGLNWLEWIVIDGRQFDDVPTVIRRVQEILTRLVFLVEQNTI